MAVVINGSGTVTGLAVGGLPDGTVDAGTLATDSVTAVKIPDTVEADLKSGRKNLIINGAMQMAQRGTSVTAAANNYALDRFNIETVHLDQFVGTMTQDSDAPNEFSNSLKITTTTAETSISSNEYFYITQIIEAQNLQHLAFGTSDAKTITLSFWIKSSQTGVFGVSLYTQDNTGIANSTYTINTASTWEYKTITFTGDASRAINNDNGIGMYVNFHLVAGSDYTSGITDENFEVYTPAKWAGGHVQNGVITTASATWQITGVQLEVGSTATDFEYRSYGEELALCQRYYCKSFSDSVAPANGVNSSSFSTDDGKTAGYTTNNSNSASETFPTNMRIKPAITIYGNSSGHGKYYTISSSDSWSSQAPYIGGRSTRGFNYSQNISGSTGYFIEFHWTADAEL